MAKRFRRRSSGRRAARDIIWVPIVKRLAVTESGATTDLITFADWSSSFSALGFERAVVRRIVGWYTLNQTANSTNNDATVLDAIVHVINDAVTTVADTTSKTALAGEDIICMEQWALQGAFDTVNNNQLRWAVDYRNQRKITAQDVVALTAKITTDTASPAVNLNFYGRALIDRT